MTRALISSSKKKKRRSGKSSSRLAVASKTRKERSMKNRQKKRFVRKVGLVLLAMTGIFLFASLIGVVYGFTYLQRLNEEIPSPDQPFKDPPVSTIIYDRNAIGDLSAGEQLYKVIGEENSDPVDINEIPEEVRWAFLAAEDVDFYTHDGFDTEGIIRCGLRQVQGSDELCGGSTVTQQLVKITTQDTEASVARKIRELFLATKVEQLNNKDDILQMYLTVAPFGSNIRGINTASEFYFGKKPSELTLAEAAVLSAIVQQPAWLSPTKPVDADTERSQAAVKDRQEYVLGQIEKHMSKINDQTRINQDDPEREDLFTDETIAEARAQELEYRAPVATNKKAGHFVDFVLQQLVSKPYNNGEPFTLEQLQKNGYKVYTTLDYGLQKVAEEETKVGGSRPEWNINNAALVTLRPASGEIITMAGSKAFVGERQGCDENGANCLYDPEVNVLSTLQSGGSTHKPLAYYRTFEDGVLSPGSFLPDISLAGIPGYDANGPSNWDNQFQGINMTAREAIRLSRNIPAIIALEAQGGPSKYVETSREFGYTTFESSLDFYGHSVVLGGYDVLPIEHAQAFTPFANNGDFVAYESILRIEDRNGETVYEAQPEREKIANPQAVYLLNQSLFNLENSFDGTPISWDGREISAKTGTSQDNKDSWVIAWTPDMVTLAWAGNNNNSPMDANFGFPGAAVRPWMDSYLRRIGDAKYFNAKTAFTRPANVYQGVSCIAAGEEDSENKSCEHLRGADWLIQGNEPPGYIVTETVDVCKDQQNRLARDIDRSLGFSLSKTIKQYIMPATAWQQYLDRYVSGNGSIPTENCTIDRFSGSSGVVFNISNPKSGTVLGNNVTVTGGIFSSNGNVSNASVYLDGTFLGSISNNFGDFSTSFNINSLGLEDGTYPFRIDATDNSGASDSYSVNVIVGSPTSSSFSFNLPSSPLEHGSDIGSGNTQTVRATYTGSASISNVTLYQTSSAGTAAIGTMTASGGGSYTIQWGATIPRPSGNETYRFFVEAASGSGTVTSDTSGPVIVVD